MSTTAPEAAKVIGRVRMVFPAPATKAPVGAALDAAVHKVFEAAPDTAVLGVPARIKGAASEALVPTALAAVVQRTRSVKPGRSWGGYPAVATRVEGNQYEYFTESVVYAAPKVARAAPPVFYQLPLPSN